MRKYTLFTAFILLMAFVFPPGLEPEKQMAVVKTHLSNALKTLKYPFLYPRTLNLDGSLRTIESRDWTSGFFVGNLWQMYEYTKDETWRKEAQKWNIGLEKEKFNTRTHDVGVILYCSFGNGFRLTKNPHYKEILLQGARSLCTRFNSKTGCIRSWNHGKWQFPVIIDNMINLELLFWATRVSGDSSFYKIATSHANTTMENHFRTDNSSYHVVDYDTLSGKVRGKVTHQGYANESAWARGQAWGLYGFTVAYRETGDLRYLQQAEKIADYFIGHPNLPEDKIPYWDFDAPKIPEEERDASAAAIAASGLLELSRYSKKGNTYLNIATQILERLSSPDYLAKPGSNRNFILMHSVGHKPSNYEIDVPLIYADYYYIQGLLRYESLKEKKTIPGN
jgi:unsaturated chondroitin disaccharide hydrolase